jgi:hypothetical protein
MLLTSGSNNVIASPKYDYFLPVYQQEVSTTCNPVQSKYDYTAPFEG